MPHLSTATRLGPYEILAPLGSFGIVVLFAIAGATAILRAQQPAPDLVLSNGKIITVVRPSGQFPDGASTDPDSCFSELLVIPFV